MAAGDSPTLEGYGHYLLGQGDPMRLQCEACSQARVAGVIYATNKLTASKVRTFCCMDCGIAAVKNSKGKDTSWDVVMFKLGQEIKVEVETDEHSVTNDGASVPGVPGGPATVES
jgi:hypothetical protein